MTSLGVNVDNSINNGKGPYIFRVSGQIYHWIGSMCPEEGSDPRFLQLYIYDTTNEVKNRMAHFGGNHQNGLKKEIVEDLIEFLDNHSALVQLFRIARDKYMDLEIPEFKVRLYNVVGTRRYEVPTPETIGAIVFGDSSTKDNEFDLIDRLDYIRKNQSEIRNEYLSGLYDAIMRGDRNGSDLGTRLVLSATFTGGPRYMYSHYLDALAICRVHENHLFITFTCNTNWSKIEEYMNAFPELTSADRADIVDRVFEKILYTIEFQKRGLPHCHSLLWLNESSKIHQDSDVDKYINAELPNPTDDADGYRVISELMMHGPCGYANSNATCMKDGTNYNRNFPKPYFDRTFVDKDGYVHYRRRETGVDIERQGIQLDNRLSKTLHLPQIEKTEAKMKASVLFDLEAMLNSNFKSLKDFGLSMPPQDTLKILQNKLLMEEKNYNPELLAKEKDALIPKLNTEQKDIFDDIVNAVNNNIQKLIFVYGHGGTGKTFLWKAITCALRSAEKVVLAVASSDLLRETNLIIWDEAPMSDRHCFEALDRSLKDILNNSNTMFGGKSIILGGDFKQTLPVKKKGSKIKIADASITSSCLWPYFKTYILKENMRLTQPNMTEHEKEQKKTFSAWLLNIGDGTIGTCTESDTEDSATVQIPHELCIQESDTTLTELINFIYNKGTLHRPTAKDLQKKAIVCPKNETADMIKAKVLSLLDEPTRVYLSSDQATPHGDDGGETELLYPNEYLNSLNFAGLPPHRLELKVGASIILLRNLNLANGLCNERKTLAPTTTEKGKATAYTPEIISLKNIRPTHTNKTIEARVYRKWTARNVTTKEPMHFCCILLDKQKQKMATNYRQQDYLALWKIHQLQPIPNDLFPEHNFRFAAYNEIEDRADVNGTPLIEGFDMAAYAAMPKPVVIALNSTWATRKYGGLQLTATPTTHYYLNPNIPEATYILNVYAEFINPMDALEIQWQPYSEESQEKIRNRYCIETLLNVNLQDYKTNKLSQKNGSYCFRAIIDDGTATTTITCFSPEAHTFVPECKTVIASLNNQDMDTIHAALKETENQTYIFQYHFGKKPTEGNPTFTLDAVFKPNPQPLLTLHGTEQTTPPPVEFQSEEASSTKADDQSQDTNTKQRDTKAKRHLFEDQCPSDKRQRQDK
nr:DNA helicase [Tanacetum cinerariifolium]